MTYQQAQTIRVAVVLGIVIFVVVPLSIPGVVYMLWTRRG